jgi:glycosyltransferase involved in cell wall biosynthesis
MTEQVVQGPSQADRGANAARIVHVTTVHHPQDPRITHKELQTLRAAGFHVVLVASGRREDVPSSIPTVLLPPTETRLQRLPLQWKAYRKARSLDADVYHVHDPELLPVAFGLRHSSGAKVIYDMHEDYQGRGEIAGWMLRRLERWGFSWVDHVIVAERAYTSILGDDVPHTFIGNYFKSYDDAEPPSGSTLSSPPPWRLLYTGSIAGRRGLFTMIDLATELKERSEPDTVHLVGICRRERQRHRADILIRVRNLDDVFHRVGWSEYVPASEMGSHYRRANVGLALLEPTVDHARSLPTKFFEYLHFGLPIICTDIPLWRRFVHKYECGAVVPADDPEAVLAVLDRWRENPRRYWTLVQNARAAAPRYRWDQMEDRLLRVYRNLLS